MINAIIFWAVFGLGAAPARAAFLPRNPHRRRVAVSSATVTVDRLAAGRWDPAVAEAVDAAVALYGRGSDGPPIAVLPADNFLVKGDAAELAFQELVRKADFKFDDAFWQIVPITYGRQKIRAAYDQFSGLSPSIWEQQPTYHQYFKYFIQSYQDMCAKVSRKDCRIYLARLWRGFGKQEAADYTRAVLKEEAHRPLSIEKVGASEEDGAPVIIRHGFKPVPETMDLARLLTRRGFQLWLADLDAAPVLQASAAQLGLGQAHLLGVEQEALKDKLTGDVHEPVPIRDGKVDAVVSATGRTPVIVVGASSDDLDLLSYGNGFRLLVGAWSPMALDAARQRRWRVQPAFP